MLLPIRKGRTKGYIIQKIAEFLNAHEKVSHVNYAGLPDDKYYALAQKYMNEGRTCIVYVRYFLMSIQKFCNSLCIIAVTFYTQRKSFQSKV